MSLKCNYVFNSDDFVSDVELHFLQPPANSQACYTVIAYCISCVFVHGFALNTFSVLSEVWCTVDSLLLLRSK